MAYKVEETVIDPTRATIVLNGQAGMGKTQTGLGMSAGGASTLIVSVEEAGGLYGNVAVLTDPNDIGDVLRDMRSGGYQAAMIDGVDRLHNMAVNKIRSGTLAIGKREYKPANSDARMVYAAAGQWMHDVLYYMQRAPIIKILTMHPREFELDEGRVRAKGGVLIATQTELSVNLPPSLRVKFEQAVDFLLYITQRPGSPQSQIVATSRYVQGTAKLPTPSNEPIPLNRRLIAKHRWGNFPQGLTLSWPNLAQAIGLDAASLLPLETKEAVNE